MRKPLKKTDDMPGNLELLVLQYSLDEISASLRLLNKKIEETNAKADELVEWKNKIRGGFIAIWLIIVFAAIAMN